jgi:hypothetical protein
MQWLLCIAGALALAVPSFAQEKKPASSTKPVETSNGTLPAANGGDAGTPLESAMPPTPGPETKALAPFTKNVTWIGRSPANAWGPNSPEMPIKGTGTCKWELENLRAVCELEHTTGKGKRAIRWKRHWTYGWDFGAKAYRGAMVDSSGVATTMHGKIEGEKITWESASAVMMAGQPSKVRMSMDATDPNAIKFIGEHTMNGRWVVDEESVLKPTGK